MVTLRELISRFTEWLAKQDESRGKWENPLAKLTGREFYSLAGVATFGLLLLMVVAWRSGVNAGVGQLPYRTGGTASNTSGTPSYAPAAGNDMSQTAAVPRSSPDANSGAPAQVNAMAPPPAQAAPMASASALADPVASASPQTSPGGPPSP